MDGSLKGCVGGLVCGLAGTDLFGLLDALKLGLQGLPLLDLIGGQGTILGLGRVDNGPLGGEDVLNRLNWWFLSGMPEHALGPIGSGASRRRPGYR